ncbi:acyl-CoA dehydrogenase family protein [[Mycobacterium] nativiensis]|uniref:Acyl-CoA dehydrogenase family protein n=1 Tax=[Mycobacterium] nativiensis TaxID=2855503 RepID=A0ABU5XS34_9MYCO|nr:acyl-CoA dehydrogenase family protein [Mycolicibacter sp. MYC340]MEB3030306.1 acyl-CoA dehydrogenase family protein [Mycolicibacter sp. MYC340]
MTTSELNTSGVDRQLADMMDAVFADYRDTHPPTGPICRDTELWSRLDQLGLVRLSGSTQTGGSGANWYEAAELMSAAVRHGVRAPLAEHDVLACWLLEAVGAPIDGAARTACTLDASGTATAVPWASAAEKIVVIWRHKDIHLVADADCADLRITPSCNLIGEPRDTVSADIAELNGLEMAADLLTELRLKSALVRSIQVCAALDKILELCVEHTCARTQFGRPLSKFQAIQHLIADIAAEAALARAATETALAAAIGSGWSAPNLGFLVAVARSCAGHATSVAVRNGHQALGAIGTTIEHRLHEYTRAALAWRSEFGSVRHWDEEVTREALAAGAAGLWSLITD